MILKSDLDYLPLRINNKMRDYKFSWKLELGMQLKSIFKNFILQRLLNLCIKNIKKNAEIIL